MTPSAAKTWALRISRRQIAHAARRAVRKQVTEGHVPRVAGPVFWTSMAKSPHCPRFIVAGPDFVTVSTVGDRRGGNVNCPTRFAVLMHGLLCNEFGHRIAVAVDKTHRQRVIHSTDVERRGLGEETKVTRSVHPSPGGVG